MKLNWNNNTLGMGQCAGLERDCLGASYGHRPALWIATAIGAGIGLASSLIGGTQASKAAKRAERRQRQQEAEEAAWYNRRYNEDYIDTAAGQRLITRANQMADKWRKEARGAKAVGGGTDAAEAVAKEQANKMVGDTIADIAANDTARKTAVDNAHRAAQNQFAQMDMQRSMQQAQNITNAASQASNALLQAGSAMESATDLVGGNNKGVTRSASGVQPTGGGVQADDWWEHPHLHL